MKKLIIFCYTLIFPLIIYSQDYGFVNEDNGKTYNSQNETNSNISIPLYTIKLNENSIPIYLTYNNKGRKISDVPNSLGFNWSLKAGGEITKTINHLVDESEDGWFNNNPQGIYNSGYFGTDDSLFKTVDASPDLFQMSLSNGSYLDFLFNWESTTYSSYLNRITLDSDKNYPIVDVENLSYSLNANDLEQEYTSENDYDIKIDSENGYNYLFRKGIKRLRPWDIRRYYDGQYIQNDSANYTNYYLHKIKTNHNNEFIKYDYLTTKLKKYILHSKATREQTNSDPYNHPHPNDPFVTKGYYSDISVEDISRKEIKKITTNKEIIEFIYNEESYYNSFLNFLNNGNVNNDLKNQKVKILKEINITDVFGNFKLGYRFHYNNNSQQQIPDYGLKLMYIERIGFNKVESYVFKKFDYYPMLQQTIEVTDLSRDVFDYPNGQTNNQEDFMIINSITSQIDRKPNLNSIKQGMLKSITSEMGGGVNFEYKLNLHNEMYFGGLLVDKIKTYDYSNNLIRQKNYIYENPEGFGLKVFDSSQYQQGTVPPNIYSEGYYEESVMWYPWQTYFTKLDTKLNFYPSNIPMYNIYSNPQELMRVTSDIDSYIQILGLQGYSQLQFGSFYKKVTEIDVNTVNNTVDKGKIVKYYRPSLKGFVLNKLLEKTEYINSSDIIVKEVKNNYNVVNLGYINAYKWNNVHLQDNNPRNDLFRYVIENYTIYNIEDVLESMEIKDFDNTGNLISSSKNEFTYLNEDNANLSMHDYNSIKLIKNYINSELISKQENIFYSEIANQNSSNPSIILWNRNPLIESISWVKQNNEWFLESSFVTDFFTDGKVKRTSFVKGNTSTNTFYKENNYTSSYYNSSDNLVTLAQEDILEYFYDQNGYISVEKNVKSGISRVYQRSIEYNGLYTDAILNTTLDYNHHSPLFIKKSFENLSQSNVIKFDRAFSGTYVFNGSSLSLGSFPANYLISFWSFENNKWKYNSQVHNGGLVTINKPTSALYIDEIRVQPISSSLESYTTKLLIGNTSQLDDRGSGNRIEYNLFGEPLFIFDKDGNVLKEFRKNRRTININN